MIKVPYFSQGNLYRCSVACIRMILAKFGIKKTEKELEKLLNLKAEGGIDLGKIQNFLKKIKIESIYDYDSKNSKEAFEKLEEHLKKGFPVVALLNRFVYDKKTPLIDKKVSWETKKFSLHYVVITGIDKEYVYFNDPHKEVGVTKLKRNIFSKAWSYNLPWKFVFLAVKKPK